MTTRVSLAELAAAGIQLRPAEAVSIVSDICRRCATAELRGVPSPGVVRLTRDGDMFVEGPTTTGDEVRRAAQLLSDLLAGFDATPEYRASGALRLVVARALGTLDLPPYASLEDFCAALSRFADGSLADTCRALFHAWERGRATRELQLREPAALTISDIRRARRATGLTLKELSAVAEVPATQLRDLEWGDVRHWRADETGRAQVIRYARAAGLDEGLVLSIAWPLIQEAAESPIVSEETALVPAGPRVIALPRRTRVAVPVRGRYLRWAAAAVGVLLLALATLFALREVSPELRRARAADVQVGDSRSTAVPMDDSRAAAVQIGDSRSAAAPIVIVPPERVRAPHTRPAAARKAPAAAKKPAPHRKNLFERELIRLVFR